jgi:hypothetical protein
MVETMRAALTNLSDAKVNGIGPVVDLGLK